MLDSLEPINLLCTLAKPTIAFRWVTPYVLEQRGHHSFAHLLSEMSHLGGNPYVPDGFSWPYYEVMDLDRHEYGEDIPDRFPLSFVAQFDLSELAKYDGSNQLPKDGVLAFFCNYNPELPRACKVFHFAKDEVLHELKPTTEVAEFIKNPIPYARINVDRLLSIPSYDEIYALGLDFEKPDGNVIDGDMLSILDVEYEDMIDEIGHATGIVINNHNQLLGYAHFLNRCFMEKEDTLLLEIDSYFSVGDDPSSFTIADGGALYICVKKDDLKQGKFDNCYCEVQTYAPEGCYD